MASSVKKNQPQSEPTFKIFSAAVKAIEENGKKRLSCTASSSVEDLHGDTITDDCVRDMTNQAKNSNMTIFLNHRYSVPEDVMGSTTDARSVSRAHEKDGTPIWDMDLDIDVNETNPRALNTYAAVKAGAKLGVSIGANIEEWEFKDKEKGWWGGLIIKKVNLLEASVVGIPANPRSWVQNAVHALKTAYDVPEQEEILDELAEKVAEVEAKEVTYKFLLDGVDVTNKLTRVVTEKTVKAGEPILVDGFEEVFSIEVVKDEGDTTVITLTPKEGVADNDTETADGETAGEEGTDPASETETPESEEEVEAEKAEAPTSPVDLEAAKALVASGETESGDSSTLKDLILSLVENLEKAISDRDAALAKLAEKEAMLADAAEIISTIAKIPLGRKTSFSAPVKKFTDRFGGIYDAEFLKKLDERE